jgi:hypothetical protein
MRRYRPMRSLVYGLVLVGLGGAPGYARHGELPHRIPEAAPYNGGEGDTSIPLGGSSPRAEETPAMTHSTAPVGPPVDGPPQPPKPDAALPPSTHTARP